MVFSRRLFIGLALYNDGVSAEQAVDLGRVRFEQLGDPILDNGNIQAIRDSAAENHIVSSLVHTFAYFCS